MKIDFEFKQGDYVELAGMSDEQVEAVKDEMLKQVEGEWWGNTKRHPIDKAIEVNWEGEVFYTTGDLAVEDRLLTVKDIFPTLEETDDTDVENTRTPLEECCEGGEMSAGCYHDNCTGANSEEEFSLQDVTSWRCFKEVAAILGEEDAEWELSKVLQQINEEGFAEGDCREDLSEERLSAAFDWSSTTQGVVFWGDISAGIKPEDYDITPDTPSAKKPKLVISESVVGDIKETFTETHSQTLGELVEAIQTNIPPHIGIHFQPDGEVLLEADNAYVVVSELTAKEIDSAIEFVAHYGHLVIGKDDLQG